MEGSLVVEGIDMGGMEVVGLIVGVVSESCLRDAEVVERVT